MSRYYVQASWEDVPHLSAKEKAEILATIPEYQRDARTKGEPQLGAGAVFPVAESAFVVPPFSPPDYWPRGYGMDVGWKKTAAIWGANDRDSGKIYLCDEHYRGMAEPDIHASAIRGRGEWIPGVIDPAANGRSQIDGKRLLGVYQSLGLDIEKAANAVEAAINQIWLMLIGGQLKVFSSCANWLEEFRQFRRDEHGAIIDDHKFHLMACTRYFILSGRDRMKTKPLEVKERVDFVYPGERENAWMG